MYRADETGFHTFSRSTSLPQPHQSNFSTKSSSYVWYMGLLRYSISRQVRLHNWQWLIGGWCTYCELLRSSWQGTVGSVRTWNSHRRKPKLRSWRPWRCAYWQTANLHGVTSQRIVISIPPFARTWNSNRRHKTQKVFKKLYFVDCSSCYFI
jgi:hypothetical protein